jgi:transcriptional regulator GlxA family with amidase domain
MTQIPAPRPPIDSDLKVRRIAILSIPGVQMLDVAGPMDVFFEANNQIGDAPKYVVDIVGLSSDPIKALNGTRFIPDKSIYTAVGEYDTVIVAGSPGIREYEENRELTEWLVNRARHANRVGAICTGAFLLAHAGLLDGRRVTTHWNSTDRMSRMFPAIKVDPKPIFVKDGSVYTSAGVTASMDLALAMVEEDHGRKVALRIAKELILFIKRPGGQAQFSMHLAAQISEYGPIRDIQEWIINHVDQDLSAPTLAMRVGMSVRHFARLFKRETRMTPGDYVESARVEAARRILEEGNTPLKIVAGKCGFSDQSGLRRAFVRQLHVTPAEYRQTFRAGESMSGLDGDPNDAFEGLKVNEVHADASL